MSTADFLLLVLPVAAVVVFVLVVCIARVGTSRQDDPAGYRTSFGRRLDFTQQDYEALRERDGDS